MDWQEDNLSFEPPTTEELERIRSPFLAWEQDRAVVEEAEKALLDSAEQALLDSVEELSDEADNIMALASRYYSGLGVQLLWNRESGATFITVTLGGETETFPVPGDRAFDAFEHPYAYGATL